MIAALLLAVSVPGGQADRRPSSELRIVPDDEIGLAPGARGGVRIGTVELYGGVDPFEAVPGADEPPSGPLAGGVRAYFPLAGGTSVFGAFDATPWSETPADSDTQAHRRALAGVGVRRRATPLSYDVVVGPGIWARRPSRGAAEARFILTVQAALGLSF